MTPKVSIIIPCYNQATYLPKAIASLQAQTLADWECIIVDDGSHDNTAEVAANAALLDHRLRLIQQQNGGSSAARDTGLRQAKGTYIQFLDADDTIAVDKLERQTKQMDKEGMDISYTAFCSEDCYGKRSKVKSVPLSLRRLLVEWGLGASTPIHAFLYRMDFICANGLWFKSDCNCREDWKWHIACFMVHPKHRTMPEICGAIYFQNEDGKTGSYLKMQEGNFTFMVYMYHLLNGWNKTCWTYRISEELWVWLLRMIKYRSLKNIKAFLPLLNQTRIALMAILLMPLSIIGVMVYFVKTYIAR